MTENNLEPRRLRNYSLSSTLLKFEICLWCDTASPKFFLEWHFEALDVFSVWFFQTRCVPLTRGSLRALGRSQSVVLLLLQLLLLRKKQTWVCRAVHSRSGDPATVSWKHLDISKPRLFFCQMEKVVVSALWIRHLRYQDCPGQLTTFSLSVLQRAATWPLFSNYRCCYSFPA